MPDHPNFLLGYGERLTTPIQPAPSGADRSPPYAFDEARDRVLPMVTHAVEELDKLPETACPHDEAVAVVTLHPQYYAKSYQPDALLRAVDAWTVGSRPATVKPAKWTRKSAPEDTITTNLFVAAARSNLREWMAELSDWTQSTPGAKDLFKVEHFRAMGAKDRIKPILSKEKEPLLEIVLHASGARQSNYIIESFVDYAGQLGLKPDLNRMFFVGGLCFMPMRANRRVIPKIGLFSFLRVAREMPSLRPLRPITRAGRGIRSFSVTLPDQPAMDTELKVAVFDGGLDKNHPLAKWADARVPSKIGPHVTEYLEHGLGVTSAILFGSLEKGRSLERPYGVVHHYRVLDRDSEKDPDELYDVLFRIRSVLQTHQYEFVNLSIGPSLPIEDGDVHGWTAALDEMLCNGDIMATVAVGNTGELDWDSGNARIQVPSDSINALAVGAADKQGTNWQRASYSSIGPGRSPGLIKPDLLAFGGSDTHPFWILDGQRPNHSYPTCGTSYASPEALRLATGIRAHLGRILTPLSLKALLIHCTEDAGEPNRREIGWGRLPNTLEDIVICPDSVARVVYQGELSPAQYLRAHLPLPSGTLEGMVTVGATFCFATDTDPQDPSNYTQSGLGIVFRPHDQKFEDDGIHPKSSSFFQRGEYQTETELRQDAHKWETTLHRKRRMRGTSLRNPVFDIHYNAREGGGPTQMAGKIRYALIVTVSSPKTPDLYNRVVRRYRTQLQPLTPVIQIPIQI